MTKLMKFSLSCLLLVGSAFCRADAVPADEMAIRATVAADGVQHVRIDGGSYFFKPNHVIVKAKVPVELTIKGEGGFVPHNIVINAPEAGIVVEESLSSDTKTVRFTPTATGKYPFYCSKALPFTRSHRERGMEGLLEVVE